MLILLLFFKRVHLYLAHFSASVLNCGKFSHLTWRVDSVFEFLYHHFYGACRKPDRSSGTIKPMQDINANVSQLQPAVKKFHDNKQTCLLSTSLHRSGSAISHKMIKQETVVQVPFENFAFCNFLFICTSL